MKTVYLSIGSNTGLREASVLKAIRKIGASDAVQLERISSLYETEPVDCPPQAWFINAVIEVKSLLIPGDLLKRLKELERDMGRKGVHNQPREIDIDIISYAEVILDHEDIVLPHPRYAQRAFVLFPLKEIAPGFYCPRKRKSIDQMISGLKSRGEVTRISSRRIATV